MLVINTLSFVALSESEQTPKKVKQGVVKFHTPIKGVIASWVTFEDENGNEVINALSKSYAHDFFNGKDILATLQFEYKSELEKLNPSLTITIE